jgi:hypothetical protein
LSCWREGEAQGDRQPSASERLADFAEKTWIWTCVRGTYRASLWRCLEGSWHSYLWVRRVHTGLADAVWLMNSMETIRGPWQKDRTLERASPKYQSYEADLVRKSRVQATQPSNSRAADAWGHEVWEESTGWTLRLFALEISELEEGGEGT